MYHIVEIDKSTPMKLPFTLVFKTLFGGQGIQLAATGFRGTIRIWRIA